MTAARGAIGNYCCRKNTNQFLGTCGWMVIDKLILHSAVNLLHNMFTKGRPISIHNMYTHSNRTSEKVTNRYIPVSEYYQHFYTVSTLKIYNAIPADFKLKSTKVFKKLTKTWIQTSNFGVSDTCV